MKKCLLSLMIILGVTLTGCGNKSDVRDKETIQAEIDALQKELNEVSSKEMQNDSSTDSISSDESVDNLEQKAKAAYEAGDFEKFNSIYKEIENKSDELTLMKRKAVRMLFIQGTWLLHGSHRVGEISNYSLEDGIFAAVVIDGWNIRFYHCTDYKSDYTLIVDSQVDISNDTVISFSGNGVEYSFDYDGQYLIAIEKKDSVLEEMDNTLLSGAKGGYSFEYNADGWCFKKSDINLVTNDTGKNSDNSSAKKEITGISDSLEVSDLTLIKNNGYLYTSGTVTNSTLNSYTYVKIKVTYYDKNKEFLASDWTYAVDSLPLEPGEHKGFKLMKEWYGGIPSYYTVEIIDYIQK